MSGARLFQRFLGYLIVGLARRQADIPPDIETLHIERIGEQLSPRLIFAVVGTEDVRHVRPRWYRLQGYGTDCGRSSLAPDLRRLRTASIGR